MAEIKKILCPDADCNTENNADAEACSKCGIDIIGYLNLDRIFTVREKNQKRIQDEADKKAKESEPKKRPSGFGGLVRGRK